MPFDVQQQRAKKYLEQTDSNDSSLRLEALHHLQGLAYTFPGLIRTKAIALSGGDQPVRAQHVRPLRAVRVDDGATLYKYSHEELPLPPRAAT